MKAALEGIKGLFQKKQAQGSLIISEPIQAPTDRGSLVQLITGGKTIALGPHTEHLMEPQSSGNLE